VLIRHLWQFKTIVFLHWCLKRAVQLKGLTGAATSKLSLSDEEGSLRTLGSGWCVKLFFRDGIVLRGGEAQEGVLKALL
jgi:hypothetical protein